VSARSTARTDMVFVFESSAARPLRDAPQRIGPGYRVYRARENRRRAIVERIFQPARIDPLIVPEIFERPIRRR